MPTILVCFLSSSYHVTLTTRKVLLYKLLVQYLFVKLAYVNAA